MRLTVVRNKKLEKDFGTLELIFVRRNICEKVEHDGRIGKIKALSEISR